MLRHDIKFEFSIFQNIQTHGVTILNAKLSLIASAFNPPLVPTIRVTSCGFDSVTSEDFAVLDVSGQRQRFSFYILNGPIATFYDPKATNVSFSFSLSEVDSLDRKIQPGAEFTITSAGFSTVNSSYNTLTQIAIDASDFREGEQIRFIASGTKKSLDLSFNATTTMYQPDVFASTLAVTVTADDPMHAPRFRIKIVSG
ncbi:hypothetical protein PMAYCL1PPCAC_00722, partial [Pristionchus mayeri]